MRSEIQGFDNDGRKFSFGSIEFDGEKVVARPTKGHEEMMGITAAEPIMVAGGEAVYPDDEPERFVRSLWLAYSGSRVWALEAVGF